MASPKFDQDVEGVESSFDSAPRSTSPSEAPLPDWKMRGSPVSDLSTEDDKLGFRPYVDAIAAFLKHEDTRPPLSMSIEGEWGTGKSSIMLQLKAELEKSDPPSGVGLADTRTDSGNRLIRAFRAALRPKPERRRLTFWFNAWRHDKQDAMWAAFALDLTKKIRNEQSFFRRTLGDLKLAASRIETFEGWLHTISVLLLWLIIALGAAGLAVFALKLTPEERGKVTKPVFALLGYPEPKSATAEAPSTEVTGVSFLVEKMTATHVGFAALFFLISYGIWIRKHVGQNLELNLEKYLSTPDYKNRTSFIESFHGDFKKVVNAYGGNRKVFIFIDDLDRCDIPRAADLMQAINLMIGDDAHLVFILGMDREKVAAGITLKYKELIPFLKNTGGGEQISARHPSAFGYTFLEKFVQITFRVPRPSESGIEQFLKSMAQSKEQALQDEQEKQADQQERRERRQRVEVSSRADSEEVRRLVKLVAPALEWNPRRMKQFINDFRLQSYIASDLGLLDLVSEEDGPQKAKITLEQLGKFVAITMAWPDLIMDLVEYPDLLMSIYQEGKESARTPRQEWLVGRWSDEAKLADLLRAKTDSENGARYSLAQTDLRVLLNIAPRVPRDAPAGSRQSGADWREVRMPGPSGPHSGSSTQDWPVEEAPQSADPYRDVAFSSNKASVPDFAEFSPKEESTSRPARSPRAPSARPVSPKSASAPTASKKR